MLREELLFETKYGTMTGYEVFVKYCETRDWELMDQVLCLCPAKGTILERDSKFPKFSEIIDETQRARGIGKKYKRWD